MAITEVSEDWSGRQSQEIYNGSPTARRRFNVATDTEVGEFTMLAQARALEASPLPGQGESFPDEAVPFLIATSFQPQRSQDDPKLWTIDVQYTVPDSSLSLSHPEEPWLNPIAVAFSNSSVEIAFTKDLTGQLVANSAGDPLEATQESPRKTITITRNVQAHNPAAMAQREGSINSEEITVCGVPILEYCGLLKQWTGIPAYTPKLVKYYIETIIIDVILPVSEGQYQPTYRREILDQGYYARNELGHIHMKDDNDQDVTVPQNLDGEGGKLPPGGTPVYKMFFQRKELAWAGLPSDL